MFHPDWQWTGPIMKRRDFIIRTASGASLILPVIRAGAAVPCPPSPVMVGGGTSASTTCNATTAAADWNARISGAGVVWHHNFDKAAEVDAFRWTGGYRGGNDPRAVGSAAAPRTSWVASGGADGGGYMQILRLAGSGDGGGDGTLWWRPFDPIFGAGNGRGVDDPGANGSIRPRSFLATDGGSETYNWSTGWYGHSTYQNSSFDGTEFYLQVRVMADPRRTTPGNTQVGKFVWFSTTPASYTQQELVTYSGQFVTPSSGVGAPNYHNIYQGANYSPLRDVAVPAVSGTRIQVNSAIAGVCDPYTGSVGGCWAYSGGWDTLLYHLVPGRNGVAETRLEVYAAHPNQKAYTKIWDVIYPAVFDQGANTAGNAMRNGWNALLLAIYQNAQTNSEYWHRFDQVIFSREFIPCPQA